MMRYRHWVFGLLLLAGAAQAGPKEDAAYRAAVTAFQAGDAPTAIADLQTVVAGEPKFAPARGLLGYLYLKDGQYQDAAKQLQAAVKLTPSDEAARNNLGDAYAKLGKWDKALAQYQEALTLKPQDAGAKSNLAAAWFRLGLRDRDANPSASAHAMQEALKLGVPQASEAHFVLGTLYAKQYVKDPARAAAQFEASAEADPKNFAAWYDLGVADQQQGKADDAVAAYARAVALKPSDGNANLNLGLLLASEKDPRAMTYLAQAAAILPNSVTAHAALAPLYDAQGDWTQARSEWQTAISLAPGSAASRTAFADALMAHKQYADAAAQYEALARLEPGSAAVQVSCGLAYEALGDLTTAQSAFEAALTLAAKDAQAENDLGVVYEKEGKDALALASYRKAAALDPNLPQARQNIARFAAR